MDHNVANMQTSLKLKVGIYLALALTLSMSVFTFLVVRHQREQMLEAAKDHLGQVSEMSPEVLATR